MTTRQRLLAPSSRNPLSREANHAPVCDAPRSAAARPRSATSTESVDFSGIPTAAIRSALRALPCAAGAQAGLRDVRRLRPLVAEAHEILRKRLETGGAVEDYLRSRARLADSAVVGLLHIASLATGLRDDGMVAPLAAVASAATGEANWRRVRFDKPTPSLRSDAAERRSCASPPKEAGESRSPS